MRDQFLQAIWNDIDNRESYQVYADWLLEQGDPLGEFIQLQLALEEDVPKEKRKKLKSQEKRMLKKHQTTWLEDLATAIFMEKGSQERSLDYGFEFRRGFLSELSLHDPHRDFFHQLPRSPSRHTLQTLVLMGEPTDEPSTPKIHSAQDPNDWYSFEDHGELGVLSAGGFRNLRKIDYGGYSEKESSWVNYRGLYLLIRNTPSLEWIALTSHDELDVPILGEPMPSLRKLEFLHQYRYDLAELANNQSLRNLETLFLKSHALDADDESAIRQDDLRALVNSENLTSLKNLRLQLFSPGDEGIRTIVNSKIWGQLEQLDFCFGAISDVGAQLLLDQIKNTSNKIDKIDLTFNQLSRKMVQELSALSINVEAKRQQPVGSTDYLFEGDYE